MSVFQGETEDSEGTCAKHGDTECTDRPQQVTAAERVGHFYLL